MAVTYVDSAVNSTRADGDTTGISVTHGFTLQNSDVLYAFLARSDDLGTAWAGSGTTWVEVSNVSGTTGNDMLATLLRRVVVTAGSEPSSYTFVTGAGAGTNQQVAIIVQVRGANTSSPEEVLGALNYGTNTFTPANSATSPVTVSENDSLLIAVHAACMNDGVSGKTGGAPSGMTLAEFDEEILAGQVGQFAEVAYQSRNAGSYTATNWTGSPSDSTSEFIIGLIAVKPAAVTTFMPKVMII